MLLVGLWGREIYIKRLDSWVKIGYVPWDDEQASDAFSVVGPLRWYSRSHAFPGLLPALMPMIHDHWVLLGGTRIRPKRSLSPPSSVLFLDLERERQA